MIKRGVITWKLLTGCLFLILVPVLQSAESHVSACNGKDGLSFVSITTVISQGSLSHLTTDGYYGASAAPAMVMVEKFRNTPDILDPPDLMDPANPMGSPDPSDQPGLSDPPDHPGSTPDSQLQSLRSVIRILEAETGFRFLYRDALVSGIEIRFVFSNDWREDLAAQVKGAGLDLVLSEERKQVVIFRADDPGEQAVEVRLRNLVGYVIDQQTGERLPFATVVWESHENSRESERPISTYDPISTHDPTSTHDKIARIQGVQSDLQGRFRLTVPDGVDLYLRISYVGYQARELVITAEELPKIREIPVRLESSALEGKEIVLQAPVMQRSSGGASTGYLMLDGFSPLGETNTIRMLQTLPSVGMGTGLSDGAFIRGSSSDAMQVLLDGSVIYNQSHLFGLVDSFNADAIRTSSFHYDVTPARYQGPPGGTLRLITRAGSLYRYRGSAGVSSSALSGGVEGPLLPGRSSWLLSGRTSLLNGLGFPGTDDLVAWGLNVARPNSLDSDAATLEERIVTPGAFDVQFHDLHGKVFVEDNHGNRWMLSGYSGFNRTEQEALRLVRQRPVSPGSSLVREQFDTRNRWGNRSANLGFYRPLEEDRTLHLRTGLSYYHTRYLKEDFTYQRPGRNGQGQLMFVHPFENQSELTHWYAEAEMAQFRPLGRGDRLAFFPHLENLQWGLAVHGYRSTYLEESLNHPRYFLESTPVLLESYLDSQWKPGPFRQVLPFALEAGVRAQYFSEGGYFRMSPRLKAEFLPQANISPSFGYSRTYQYLYKLSFYNQTTSDIWITANEHQKPASVDTWSAAVHIRFVDGWFLRSEWYYKHQRNLRFHEINIQSVQTPLEGAPWFADNTGYARGWELQAGFSGNRLSLTQSYTLSRVELSNPRLNRGERFLAYWDRTHQFNTLLSLRLLPGLVVDGNWFLASGVPDRLDLFRSGNTRLGTYSRIDLSVRYDIASGPHRWALQAGVYNLMNRQNPWYRDWVQTVNESMQSRRLEPVQVDFYDLGFQPSLSLRYYLDP